MSGKKIVFFTGSMGRGGAERVISILSDYLVKNGWDVTIVMLLHHFKNGYKLNENVKIKTFFPEKCSNVKKALYNLVRVRAFIKGERPDVVVSFIAQNTLISGIACSGLKLRYIASERIDPAMVKRNFIYKRILNCIYKKADKVIFQTERAKNYFSYDIQKNGVIIGNPIEISCEATRTEKRIVSAGRFTPQKNQKMLIDAFAKIVKKHPDYILEIFGDGKLRADLEKQVQELGLEQKVFLPGSVPNLHERMKNAMIFVLPSNFEGLSNALLEAMMMGFACVSTNCAGSDEIIKSCENGLLIPVGDEKALENSVEKLITDEALCERISKNGKESVQKYRLANIVEQWMEVIEGR